MRRLISGITVVIALAISALFAAGQLSGVSGSNAPTAPSTSKMPFADLDFEKVRSNGPKLSLRSAILVNYQNGEVLYAKNADMVHPIASISKLVAAMVVLDSKIDLSKTQVISKEDAYRSSRSHLAAGWELTLNDLLHAALMISDNRSTRALARAVSGSVENFVIAMNEKAQRLGLRNTVFFDPTGLDARNVSTAHEVALIMHYAYKYPQIAQITSDKNYQIRVLNRKRRVLRLGNSNRLVNYSPFTVLAGKTGHIDESAYCLATLVANPAGEKLTLVVLGAPGGKLRFREARKLALWGFKQI
ncbi:MAG: serine hydrolase [Candidatus Zixiibacteriota bacterium]